VKTAIKKNERVLNLLAYLLRSRRFVSASDVRREVSGYNDADSSEATVARRFERDKEMLRALGVEVVYGEDPVTGLGGYAIPKPSAYMAAVELDDEELRLLVVLAASGGHADSPLSENLAGACQKLLAQSALGDRPLAGAGRRLVHASGAASDKSLSANLGAVAVALEKRRRVRFTYYGIYRDEVSCRTVEPYGLRFFRGQWYLVARCTEKDDVRVFRLDRIKGRVQSASPGEKPEYDVPAGFSTADYVGKSPWQLSRKEPFAATVELDEIGAWLVGQARPAGVKIASRGGRTLAKAEVRNETAFFKWLVSLGTHARLVSPDGAVKRFVGFLEGLAGQCQR
jgi:proteasome accessory factor C